MVGSKTNKLDPPIKKNNEVFVFGELANYLLEKRGEKYRKSRKIEGPEEWYDVQNAREGYENGNMKGLLGLKISIK